MIPDRHLDRLEQDAADGKKLSPAHTILLIDALRETQAKASTPAHKLIEAGELMNAAMGQMMEEFKARMAATEARQQELVAIKEKTQSGLDELDTKINELRVMSDEMESQITTLWGLVSKAQPE